MQALALPLSMLRALRAYAFTVVGSGWGKQLPREFKIQQREGWLMAQDPYEASRNELCCMGLTH